MQVHDEVAASSALRQRAVEIAAGNGGHLGMSRADAEAYLKSQGHEPGPDRKSLYKAPDRAAVDYAIPEDAPIARQDLARLRLDPLTAKVLVEHMAANPKVDHEQVAKEVERTGAVYKDLIADVTAWAAGAGVKLNVASLPAHALSQLAAVAGHNAKLASRPRI